MSRYDSELLKTGGVQSQSVSAHVDDPVQVINGNQNWHTSYRGVSPEYFDIKRWYLDQGAFFSQDDVDRGSHVCVLGRTVRDQLFGVADPISRVIRVNNLPCKIVATLQPKSGFGMLVRCLSFATFFAVRSSLQNNVSPFL